MNGTVCKIHRKLPAFTSSNLSFSSNKYKYETIIQTNFIELEKQITTSGFQVLHSNLPCKQVGPFNLNFIFFFP